MTPPAQTNPRRDLSISGTDSSYIAIFTIGGILIFGGLLLFFSYYRFRVRKIRSDNRGAAFLHVRGVVRPSESNPHPSSLPPPFSREMLTPSVVMPEKALTGKLVPSDRISITSPASAPCRRPHSNISPVTPRPRSMSVLNPAHPRHSRSSSGFSGYSQFRLPPGLHSCRSSISSPSSQTRPVRQLFEPQLPDELPLSQCGENLTVLRSFDDGWCLVARETSRSSQASVFVPSRLSARIKGDNEHIEYGVVPAWVFVKPTKGLTVTRPLRNTSADALQPEGDVSPPREAVISWSHLA